ncbi:hypothetical protein KPB1_5263 [Klebsiella pneumoniae Kb140]|nr:hypothetical protein KPB1_5269 [Klebsiella pneumoniae Kb140]EYB80498.1 hypothetical protein KPB1_5263 [Klebsiella pneumoniae Kb140]WOL84945.1 hypothetical protein OKAMMKCO_00096 [Klebsiella pneumoniae]
MRAARQRGQVFPAPQARGLSRRGQTGTDAPFACSVPESVNKHRDRDLKSICQRPHVIKGQTAFTTEEPADERFITYLVFEIGLRKPVLLHKNPQQRYTVFACFEARIKFFKFHRVIFPGIDAGSQHINQRAARIMFQKIFNEFTCLFVIFAGRTATQQRDNTRQVIHRFIGIANHSNLLNFKVNTAGSGVPNQRLNTHSRSVLLHT